MWLKLNTFQVIFVFHYTACRLWCDPIHSLSQENFHHRRPLPDLVVSKSGPFCSSDSCTGMWTLSFSSPCEKVNFVHVLRFMKKKLFCHLSASFEFGVTWNSFYIFIYYILYLVILNVWYQYICVFAYIFKLL